MSHSQERANGTLELARFAGDALEVIAEAIGAINVGWGASERFRI